MKAFSHGLVAHAGRRLVWLVLVLWLCTWMSAASAQSSVTNTASVTPAPGGRTSGDGCTAVGGVFDAATGRCASAVTLPVSRTTIAKSAAPATGTPVSAADTLAYSLTATVENAATTAAITFTDTLGPGLSAATLPGTCSAAGQVISCILPAGSAVGTHLFSYTATVDLDAVGPTLDNTVVGGSGCTTPGGCATSHPLAPSTVTVAKSSDPVGGSQVSPGSNIQYTLTATVSGSQTTANVPFTDTLGAGLSPAVLPAACTAVGQVITCVLPAGSLPGTHDFVYTASVDAGASGALDNTVVGGDGCTAPGACTTQHVVAPSTTRVGKSSNPANGTTVLPGARIDYQLRIAVEGSISTTDAVFVDTLGPGLTLSGAMPSGCSAAGRTVTCVVPAGTLPGVYRYFYAATVDADASGSVGNAVVGGDGCITVGACATLHPVQAARVTVAKSSNPPSGTAVLPEARIEYLLTVTVADAVTTADTRFTDTLSPGLTLATVPAGCTAAGQVLTCVLPAGSLPGSYAFAYAATVDVDASGVLGNGVTGGDGCTVAGGCVTQHPVEASVVRVAKQADPASGVAVQPGDLIGYVLTVDVDNAPTTEVLRLLDTLQGAQTLDPASIEAPAGGSCAVLAAGLECTLAQGARPGRHVFRYRTVVDANASGSIGNGVVANGGSSTEPPVCDTCTTQHPIVEPVVTVGKSASPGAGATVGTGSTIEYVLTVAIENATTTAPLILTDTPDPSLELGTLPAGCAPTAGGIACTLPAGTVPGTYTFRYTARVSEDASSLIANRVEASGGGPREPTCANCQIEHEVIKFDQLRLTKITTTREARVGDLIRYSLTIENVGQRDLVDATLIDTPPPGFSLVAGSVTVADDDGAHRLGPGHVPLQIGGIDIGVGRHATVSYLLRVGAGVRTGPQVNQAHVAGADGGRLSNLATAEVSLVSDALTEDALVFGTVFDDRNGDGWQDEGERGVPGVRIAAVEGLLVETDPHGRYHLAGIHGGAWERGRNFILKVDPSTLPPGTEFTTENPRVRRVTPGVPVRFDFGVRLPEQVIEGAREQIELELGEVIFLADSATLRPAYWPVVERMAVQVEAHGGGEVVILAEGDSEGLAYDRAAAVREALLPHLSTAAAAALTIHLRTRVEDPHSLVAGVDAGGALLGTVLFDTDRATLRSEFDPLLDRVAASLQTRGGGVVVIVGHADVRGSHAYNAALGLRRAQAVQRALAERLSPEVLQRVRVESSGDPAAPAGADRGRGE